MNPSIFNDILGPVMRGPSSSHTAASWRIAQVALQLLADEVSSALVEFDQHGAWASNYRPQGTVLGMSGGLLNISLESEDILNHGRIAKDRNVDIQYQVSSFPADHPNTVRLSLQGKKGGRMTLTAVSTGGGMMEIRQVDDIPVNIAGDYYEMLFCYPGVLTQDDKDRIEAVIPDSYVTHWFAVGAQEVLNVKSGLPFNQKTIDRLQEVHTIGDFSKVHPVLPVPSGLAEEHPFDTISGMLTYSMTQRLDLGQTGMVYEQARSGFSKETLQHMMGKLVDRVEHSISAALKGTHYPGRILQQQSHLLQGGQAEAKFFSPLINRIISYVTAIMEYKSAMGVIVAIPTAGSCGTVGGVLKAVSEELECSRQALVDAYFAAGMVGVFFARGPGFSAEEHGCQVETGAAGCMAAAGLVQLYGGTAQMAVNAASMALQNSMGLICDPVADRVEVPCLGKNIGAAVNALSAATMALSGYDPVIPLDESIQAVEEVGKHMHSDFCCTGRGGLANTPTSRKIYDRLANEDENHSR
ncbi:MAG TPA: L-serine ammonia-lyase, iron-sulfur-dependent, subunit alpha [Bacteroidales bacterium]|nr:L-serine ammonia-lyase, iron-sulfur-dependent, subunit alpha [Bacteroidales bacterium]